MDKFKCIKCGQDIEDDFDIVVEGDAIYHVNCYSVKETILEEIKDFINFWVIKLWYFFPK